MPFDGTLYGAPRRPALMTAAAALALYSAARFADNEAEALPAAADAMAAILRAQEEKAANRPAKADKNGPLSRVFNAENLAACLSRMLAIVEARNTVPILSNVRLQSTGGRLIVTGSDLDMEYTETLHDALDLPEFDTTADARTLAGVLKGTKGAVGLSVDEAHLIVEAGGNSNRLTRLPSGDFPLMLFDKRATDSVGGFESLAVISAFIPAARLRDSLAFVQAGISTEETRYYLNGAYMHLTFSEGLHRLSFVSTDGHRMFFDQGEEQPFESVGSFAGVIVPRKAVGWLVKHLEGAGDVLLEIVTDHPYQKIRVTTERGVYTSKVIDGSYPDYVRVIPRGDWTKSRVTIGDAKAAADCIGRLAAMSAEKSCSVRLTLHDGQMSGTVRNVEAGKSEAVIPSATVDGQDGEIGFNARYVLDVLARGPIVMHFEDPASPARCEYPATPGRIAVVMPLRI